MKTLNGIGLLLASLTLASCASVPTGPSVMVLPGTGKSFEQFRYDDAICREFAFNQIGGTTANQAATNAAVSSAAVGTAIGAAAGAAFGGHEGAGVGAGTGLIVGSAAGSGAAQASAWDAQSRYDVAYVQCMYAKGNQVPVSGNLAPRPQRSPGYYPPPPPPGYAPPPR